MMPSVTRKREPRVVQVFGSEPTDLEEPISVEYEGHTIQVTLQEKAGRLEVFAVRVVRIPERGRKARRISGTELRLPWAWIIETARNWHAANVMRTAYTPLSEDEAEEFYPARREAKSLGFKLEPIKPPGVAESTRVHAARRQLPAVVAGLQDRTARRGRPAMYDLQQVADLYRDGYRTSDAPTKYVAERLGVSRSTAGKQVARARAEGMLELAPKQGVPGLVKPRKRKRGKK
jgi:hypothetical protein